MNAYISSMLYGFMVYWDEEKDAARYFVHLLIGDENVTKEIINYRDNKVKKRVETYQEIDLVEVERSKKYYTFANLAKIDVVRNHNNDLDSTGKNYYVFVEAEDKNGKIIAKTEKVCAIVETFSNTGNGTLIIRR